MALKKKLKLPMGLPGQLSGLSTLQSDRGDEVQELFTYQWMAGVLFLLGALAKDNVYEAIWCEHHEDYLAELANGQYDAIQVKTTSGEGAKWKLGDTDLVKSISRFCQLEIQHGTLIARYVFFSNAPPYIPGATAMKPETLGTSPMRLRDLCREHAKPTDVPTPYNQALSKLAKSLSVPELLIFQVLGKLEFQKGPSLLDFRDSLTYAVINIPSCNNLVVKRALAIRDELVLLVQRATTLDASGLECFTSVLASDGRPEARIRGKRVAVEAARITIERVNKDMFRYAEAGGRLQLGKAANQKEVLRQKMNNGYVGSFFDSLWLQALSAEQRLLERAITDPVSTDNVVNQLTAVVLVECQNAEAMAGLEVDERRRGLQIYQQILRRTDELSKLEPAKVENEHAETLRGIAGLLSGGCNFAWGVNLESEGKDGS